MDQELQFSQGFADGQDYDFDDCRRTFLLTYSQADLERFPSCTVFSNVVIAAIRACESKRELLEWAVSMEDHKDGGKHYHMSVKFSGPRRWKPIWFKIYENFKISVDFALDISAGYVAAYRYVAKKKNFEEILHSENHTKLENIKSPKTKKAMHKFGEKRRLSKASTAKGPADQEAGPSMPKKAKRLSNSNVADFLIRHNIRSDIVLLNESKKRALEDPDLRAFILNKTPSQRRDLLKTTWEIEDASEVIKRRNANHMEVIRSYSEKDCVANCNGIWLSSAKEVLDKNNIHVNSFAEAMRKSFTVGRRNHVNIMLTGESNCAKSFLLEPIELIFKTFLNPATGKYAWVGLDECEAVFLNDFRYSPEVIAWSDFLLLLEGATVHLPRPKNMFATDMEISRHSVLPIFATGPGPIRHKDEIETDMMASRWQLFKFRYKIPQNDIIVMEPCPACFSKLVLTGSTTEDTEH